MQLPFTQEQFLHVFELYNLSLWPVQAALNLIALAICALILAGVRKNGVYISVMLSFLWLWTGTVYHIIFFTSINGAAYVFGGLFLLQALIFLIQAIREKEASYSAGQSSFRLFTGAFMIVYALIIYPLLGSLAGHSFPRNPTFGLPCPTTIFTLGILLYYQKLTVKLFLIPVIWSAIGFTAALKLGIYEDTGLIISALLVITAFYLSRRANAQG